MIIVVVEGLVNMKYCPVIPDSLKPFIDIHASCEVTAHEGELLFVAMYCLDKYAASGHHFIGRTNVLFVDRDDFTVRFEDHSCAGCHFSFAVYPIHIWHELQLSDYQMLTCMVEELCHALYLITDEVAVKHVVLEVIKHYEPRMTFEALFPGLQK